VTSTSQRSSAAAGAAPAASLRARAEATGKQIVLLHIGEPKTGTTFLQDAMWANRGRLRASGVNLPGTHSYDQYRASRDLRNFRYDGTHPRGSWIGEWDILAAQARRCDGVAVISHEILMAARPAQIARAVASLAPAEVHIAITVRDLGSLLPAAWQEAVKNGETRGWDEWVRLVVDRQSRQRSPQRRGFWRLHDTVPTVRRWAKHVPPAHIHVVTVPPPGAPRDLLWQRWAELIGFDTADTKVTAARANSSLGWAEAEFLREVNTKLRGTIPHWMYETYIKPQFAEVMLGRRPRTATPALTVDAARWVDGYTRRRARTLRAIGVHVCGDLAELRRRPDRTPRTGGSPGAKQLADVGVDAVAQLLAERVQHPVEKPSEALPDQPWVDRAIGRAVSSNRLKRSIRELSVRHKWLGKVRIAVWRLANRR
jgi:hypothetical protein